MQEFCKLWKFVAVIASKKKEKYPYAQRPLLHVNLFFMCSSDIRRSLSLINFDNSTTRFVGLNCEPWWSQTLSCCIGYGNIILKFVDLFYKLFMTSIKSLFVHFSIVTLLYAKFIFYVCSVQKSEYCTLVFLMC